MFKSALLALKPAPLKGEYLDFAVALTMRHGMQLTVCTVIDTARLAPAEAMPIGAGAFKKERDEAIVAAAREEAAQSLSNCKSACTQSGVPCRTDVCDGDTVEVLARHAQEHDLMILRHMTGEDTSDESLLRDILKHSPRPAIVYAGLPVQGENVVVAYDGSVQAARTLASFVYSGLAAGRRIQVVTCHADSAHADAVSGVACRFLEHYGFDATAHAACLEGDPGQTLLIQVEKHSAGLLVMGAFGKTAAREFFFGSVTRKVLHNATVPVFLNH